MFSFSFDALSLPCFPFRQPEWLIYFLWFSHSSPSHFSASLMSFALFSDILHSTRIYFNGWLVVSSRFVLINCFCVDAFHLGSFLLFHLRLICFL